MFTWLHDHLIPHRGNGHTPRALHHGPLFSYSVLLIVLKILALSVSVVLPAASVFSAAITANNIVSLTNETRRELELPELAIDSKLAMAAQAKADDMLAKGYFAHVSPDGHSPWYWFEQYGYHYRSAGENLAANFMQAEDVTAGWMASPEHRDNIVNERYNEIGVGVAQGIFEGYSTTFVVQLFGYELNEDSPEAVPLTTVAASALDGAVLSIDDTQTIVTPAKASYAVAVHLANATEAMLRLGNYSVPLLHASGTLWQATIPFDPANLDPAGTPLTLVASDQDGVHLIRTLALVLPESSTSSLYAFGATNNATPKLLGVFDVTKIDDHVTRFYIYTMIALGSLLLLALVLKFRQQKIHLVAHVLAVIGVAGLLSLF